MPTGKALTDVSNVPQFDVPVNPTPHNEYKKGGCESGSNLEQPKSDILADRSASRP